MRRVLRHLHERGFIQSSTDLPPADAADLRQLAELGLADPAFIVSAETSSEPFLWTINGNGQRVLAHLTAPDPQLTLKPWAARAISLLGDDERLDVMAAAKSLLGHDPRTWADTEARRLDPDKDEYLLTVSPDLRALVRAVPGGVEVWDVVREGTIKQAVESYYGTGGGR